MANHKYVHSTAKVSPFQEEMSLTEIANELGITRQRAHQIWNKAVKNFRAGMLEKGYETGDLLPNHPDDNDTHLDL